MNEHTLTFLDSLWGDGLHSLCWMNGDGRMKSSIHDTPAGLIEAATKVADDADVWFGVNPLAERPPAGRRGGSEHVGETICLYADLDWQDSEAHADERLPTEEAVMAAVKVFKPAPSILIHSGHGLQAYWMLDEPVGSAERDQAAAGLEAMLIGAGLKPERTTDAASILRLPGTTNRKAAPVEVKILMARPGSNPATLFAAAVPVPAPRPPRSHLSVVDGGVHDHPFDWARDNIDPSVLMAEGGWTLGSTKGNEQQWTRPGKSVRQGNSATLHMPHGPLNIYSPSVDLEYERAGKRTKAEITLSVGELYAAVHHLGDVPSAMRYIRQHLMPIDASKARHPSVIDSIPVAAAVAHPATEDTASTAQALTSAAPLNLPDEFWEARPVFGHILTAAHSVPASPDATLLDTMVRYAATIHPSIVLPDFGTIDLYVLVAGHSGAGKTRAAKMARKLVPVNIPKVRADMPVGSGQGLVEGFFRYLDEDGKPCNHQKKGAEKTQWYWGLNFIADEGTVLVAAGDQGSIISQTLSQAWTGDTLGQLNADASRSRTIQPGQARVTAAINIQTANGWKLFDGRYATEGFSQRMVCTYAIDHTIHDRFGGESPQETKPAFPGALDLPSHHVVTGQERTIEVHPEVMRQVAAAAIDGHRRGWVGDPLDTHSTLARLKLAAILALMDARFDVNLEDWALAGQIMTVSKAVRDLLKSTKISADAQNYETKVTAQIELETRTDDAKHKALVRRGVASAHARIEAGKPLGKKHFSAPQREVYPEIMAILEAEGLVEDTGNGYSPTQ